jgi:hypothetical protein
MHNPLTITIVRNTLARHPARIFTHERARAALRDVDLLCRKATDAAERGQGDDEQRYRLAAIQLVDRVRGYAVRDNSSPWSGFEHLRDLAV